MIRKIVNLAQHERPPYVLLAIFRKFSEQLVGRGMASLLGWSGGYLGSGSRVIGSRHINFGARAYVNRFAWIEAVHTFRSQTFAPVIKVGEGFSASERLHISCVNRIEVGDDCLFGSGVYISDHNHGVYKGDMQSAPTQSPVDRMLTSLGPVNIGSNVWLGDNVIVVGPVIIGNGAVIGANSVVTRDVPENVIAAGAPLRLLKQFNHESEKWERYDG